MYVRGYLQGSENGRVVTIEIVCASSSLKTRFFQNCVRFRLKTLDTLSHVYVSCATMYIR
jgi:hypothetical protein